jgi:hypothetical protein
LWNLVARQILSGFLSVANVKFCGGQCKLSLPALPRHKEFQRGGKFILFCVPGGFYV